MNNTNPAENPERSRTVINSDTIEGSWKELKGKIKDKWGKFTDDEIESFKGNLDQLTGKLQKTYGYAKDFAEKEYSEFKASVKSLLQ